MQIGAQSLPVSKYTIFSKPKASQCTRKTNQFAEIILKMQNTLSSYNSGSQKNEDQEEPREASSAVSLDIGPQ